MRGRVIIAMLLAVVLGGAVVSGRSVDEAGDAGDITFHVRIEPERGGQVLCALYRDEETWLSHDVFRSEKSEATSSYATCRFARIPRGTYAIAAVHDEDRDGDMDYFLGLPLEGYAASRDAHLQGFGAPDWEDAIFAHSTTMTVQRARMKY